VATEHQLVGKGQNSLCCKECRQNLSLKHDDKLNITRAVFFQTTLSTFASPIASTGILFCKDLAGLSFIDWASPWRTWTLNFERSRTGKSTKRAGAQLAAVGPLSSDQLPRGCRCRHEVLAVHAVKYQGIPYSSTCVSSIMAPPSMQQSSRGTCWHVKLSIPPMQQCPWAAADSTGISRPRGAT
jgi:hypothetical protein